MATKSREYDTKSVTGFEELFNKNYSKMAFLKQGLALGTLGSIVAAGGVGKSMISLQDGLSVATADKESQFMRGGVLYLPAEDHPDEIGKRLQAICKAFNFDERKFELAKKNFKVWPLLGETPDILEKTDKDERPLVDAICSIAKTYEHDPLRLIFFDTLRRFSYADENDGGQMSAVLACMELLCKRLNCCCVFLHHASKGAALNGLMALQQAARGSSVLSDNIRYQEYLRAMTPDEAEELGEMINGNVKSPIGGERGRFVEWGVSKQNYGRPITPKWLKRNNDGVLMPVNLDAAGKNAKKGGGRNNEY